MKIKSRLKEIIQRKDCWLEILAFLYLVAVAFIVVMKSPLNPWSNGVATTDSSVFKYMAQVMSEGGMPYKDAFDHKGPLLYVINYIGNSISYYRGVWLIEFAFMILSVWALYKISRLFCGRFFSCFLVTAVMCPITEYFRGGNLTEEYAMPFIAVALFIFIDYFVNNRVNKLRLIICGVCFGAVLMLRANMVSVWMVFCIAVLVLSLKVEKKIPWKFLLYFMIGVAVVVIPLLVWLIGGGAFSYFINDYWIFNFKYCSDDGRANPYNRYMSIMQWISGNLYLISTASMVYLIKKREHLFFNITYLIYTIITLLLISMSGMAYGHYGMILIPMFIYPLAKTSDCMLNKEKSAGTLTVFAILLLLVIFPSWRNNIDNAANAMHSPNKAVAMSSETRELIEVIQENTSEEEKIQVIGNYNFIYVLSERLAASRYSYQVPIAGVDEGIRKEFFEDMKHYRPKMVVVQDYMNAEYNSLFVNADAYELLLVADEKVALYRLKE